MVTPVLIPVVCRTALKTASCSVVAIGQVKGVVVILHEELVLLETLLETGG